MANDYVSLATLKLALGITDTDRDTLLDNALAAASRGIDDHCGRRFWADPVAVARTYNPRGRVVCDDDGSERILVDDISSTDGLIVETGAAGGGTWTAVTGYEAAPENALADGKPITSLRLLSGSWAYGPRVRVRVTALYGWPAVPDVVVTATLLQSSRLYKRKDTPEGVMGSSEWGAIRVSRIDPDVQALVEKLVLPGIG